MIFIQYLNIKRCNIYNINIIKEYLLDENGEPKKNIEDVQVNERVLTHSGIGTVDERFRYKTNKNTVTINDEITCTANHEFYVINKDDKDKVNEDNLSDFAFWIAAGNLDKDKHLLIKKYS